MDWSKCPLMFKVYQTMFRVVKDSENVDERQHCFLVQTSGQDSRYFSVETRQELLKIENAWHCSVCTAVMKLGVPTVIIFFYWSKRNFCRIRLSQLAATEKPQV